MSWCSTVHAKWTLCGEHAVIRGGSALVLPLKKYQMTLCERPAFGESRSSISEPFWEYARKQIPALTSLHSDFTIESTIPIGRGFGSSAALCVLFSKWVQYSIKKQDLFLLSKNLENFFHAQSSGMDIAAILTEQPIVFRGGEYQVIQAKDFKWSFHDSGARPPVSETVREVQQLHRLDLDERMEESFRACLVGIQENSLKKLASGIEIANDVFKQWGLITPEMAQVQNRLKNEGALAVKPIGAGKGGFQVALWS